IQPTSQTHLGWRCCGPGWSADPSPVHQPELVEEAIACYGQEIAAAIVEPIYYNAGCILPTAEFIGTLRRLTERHGIVLIFDEVLSAFRMCLGGAQEFLGVTPDLCTLGK